MSKKNLNCQFCGAINARLYQQLFFTAVGEPYEEGNIHLCPKCARAERRKMIAAQHSALSTQHSTLNNSLSRAEVIAVLDRFWAESGALEICRRCHEQGTGCCPPMCRKLTQTGCREKNVFCTSFICSALLNAIRDCDADTARLLKWIKQNFGSAEFRIYEMVTRVPPEDREPARPLVLPDRYPGPLPLSEGKRLAAKLATMTEEVLEIRRRWHTEERAPFADNEEQA